MASTTAVRSKKSTIVRPNKVPVRLAAARAGISVLDRIAPTVAGRVATRLWCTLPTGRGRSRDDRPIGGLAAPESTTSRVTLTGGRWVTVESWGDGLPVYLMHGWGGWRGQLGAFVEPLIGRGYRIVALDAVSHGESGPGHLGAGRTTGLEMAESLRAVAEEHGAPVGVVAHSLGCAVTAWSIDDGMPAPRKLAFVAPTVGPVPHIRRFVRAVGGTGRTEEAMVRHLEGILGRPMSTFDPLPLGAAMPETLIIHDRADKEVGFAEAEQIADRWPSAWLEATDGLGHQRILRDAAVIERVTTFLTST
jgi:predicted alpha/beta hydrolase family esterase